MKKDKKNGNAKTNVGGSKPGTKEEKAKKEPKRSLHPAAIAAMDKENPVLVTSLPDDFDWSKHRPIKRKLWEQEYLFYEAEAVRFDLRAKASLVKAEKSKLLGSGQQRQAKKRLQRTMEKLLELQATAAAEGIKIEDVLDAKSAALLKDVAAAMTAREEDSDDDDDSDDDE